MQPTTSYMEIKDSCLHHFPSHDPTQISLLSREALTMASVLSQTKPRVVCVFNLTEHNFEGSYLYYLITSSLY